MAGPHLGRRHPARPQRFPIDPCPTEPSEAVAADPYAVAQRRLIFEDDIEKMVVRIDDDAGEQLAKIAPDLAKSSLVNPPDDLRARLHVFRALSDAEDTEFNKIFQDAIGA